MSEASAVLTLEDHLRGVSRTKRSGHQIDERLDDCCQFHSAILLWAQASECLGDRLSVSQLDFKPMVPRPLLAADGARVMIRRRKGSSTSTLSTATGTGTPSMLSQTKTTCLKKGRKIV